MNRHDFAALKAVSVETVIARMRSAGWFATRIGWTRDRVSMSRVVAMPWPFPDDVSIRSFIIDVATFEGIGESALIHSLTGDPAPLKAHAEWLLLTTEQRDEVCDYLATEWESILDDATSTRAERRSAHAVATARDLLIALSERPE